MPQLLCPCLIMLGCEWLGGQLPFVCHLYLVWFTLITVPLKCHSTALACRRYMCQDQMQGHGRMMAFFLAQPVLMSAQKWIYHLLGWPTSSWSADHPLIQQNHSSSSPEIRGAGKGGSGNGSKAVKASVAVWRVWVAAWVLHAVQAAITLTVLLLSAEGTFWPPLEGECAVDQKGLSDVKRLSAYVHAWVGSRLA